MNTEIQDDEDTIARRLRQDAMRARLGDILAEGGDGAIVDLLNLAGVLWAERYPAQLSEADQHLVSQNFEGATPSLLKERAMSRQGLEIAVSAFAAGASIAIDYSPDSFCLDAVEADMPLELERRKYQTAIKEAFRFALDMGISPFGAAAMMILFGGTMGCEQGLRWPAVTRALLDTLSKVMSLGGVPQSDAELEERAITTLMTTMSVSRAVAKRYVAQAKAANPDVE